LKGATRGLSAASRYGSARQRAPGFDRALPLNERSRCIRGALFPVAAFAALFSVHLLELYTAPCGLAPVLLSRHRRS